METPLLDTAYDRLHGPDAPSALEDLFLGLADRRAASMPDEWEAFVHAHCLTHPLRRVLHADPLTRRAFTKPRGYAGDAVLLDMMYTPDRVDLGDVPQPGRHVFDFNTSRSPAARAVRLRRQYIARLIDETARRSPRPRVLSVACGHLREAELADAVRRRRLGAFVALDQDEESLRVVHDDYGPLGVTAVKGSVLGLLKKRIAFDAEFDLAYAAGLYDYLNDPVARRLTAVLFDALRPGGCLMVANFLPGIRDVGYMESYMDWKLLYRSECDMVHLAAGIPRPQIDRMELSVDKVENVVFLKLFRSR